MADKPRDTMAASTEELQRMIPRISLHNFDERKDEISTQILHAAENSGFFILEDQKSPSVLEIEEMFRIA